jgi:hypothetical protein
MYSQQLSHNSFSHTLSRAAMFLLAIIFVLALILLFTQPAQAQTFQLIWTFTSGQDGANPAAGVTLDKAGNLYGTAANGGML